MTAATTTPRHSTNTAKPAWVALPSSGTVTRRLRSDQPPSASAAAAATQAGATPNGERAAKPHSMSPTTTRGTTGSATSLGAGRLFGVTARSSRKNSRCPTYSTPSTATHTGAITRANPANDNDGSHGRASRLVRFDTGSSREAEFASRAQA